MGMDWGALIGNLGISAVLAWYLYYTTTKTLPDLSATWQQSMRDIVEEFRGDLAAERASRLRTRGVLKALCRRLDTRSCLLSEGQSLRDVVARIEAYEKAGKQPPEPEK